MSLVGLSLQGCTPDTSWLIYDICCNRRNYVKLHFLLNHCVCGGSMIFVLTHMHSLVALPHVY